jgi:hypothetical protein
MCVPSRRVSLAVLALSPKKALAASSVGTDAAEESVGVAVAESVGAAAANERRHIATQSMQRSNVYSSYSTVQYRKGRTSPMFSAGFT